MKENLSQWIIEDLKKSGLNGSTIEEMGVKEVKGKDELKDYINFASIQGQSIPQATQTYLLPYHDEYNRVKLQFPPEKELSILLKDALENPFKELDRLTVENVCHALAEIGADKDKASEIFERYELKEKLGISKKTFLSSFRESQKEIAIEEKKKLGNANFLEKDGKTFAIKTSKDGQVYYDIVADFTARFSREIYNDENEVSREISIYKNGKTVKIELSSDEISELQLFRKAINKRVIVSYESTTVRQHNEFREFIEQQGEIKISKKTKYLGKLDSNCFVADNKLINESGLKENEEYILTPNRMQISGNKETLCQAFEMLYRILGKNYWKFIGFAIGSFFCNEIASRFGFFPILFLRGEKGSGKSRLAEILTALFGAQREAKPFTISSTTKSLQRAAAKYKSIPIRLNEYQSNQTNNTLLCSLYDREGYNRAKVDNSYDIQTGEVNSSFIVLSTHNITGYKAEDVASRVVEIDTNTLNKDSEAMDWLWNNRDSLSWFLVEAMKINSNDIMEAIERETRNNRKDLIDNKTEFSDRTLETHSVILACSTFSNAIARSNAEIDVASCIDSIESQTKETILADVGYSFLQTLHSMTLKQEIPQTISQTININGIETLVFSLRNTFPFVQRFSKQSDRAFADEKTLAQRLKTLGLTNKKARYFEGKTQALWFYEIPDIEE